MGGGGGVAGNGLWCCRFSAFHDRPSLENCQSLEDAREHAHNRAKSCKCANSCRNAFLSVVKTGNHEFN